MIIKILADGGSMKPGPALSQKLGPAGININQVIQQINESTKAFNGLKVPVELDVNTSKKTFEVHVFSPPVSGLIKKELGIAKGSGAQVKTKMANASIEQLISIAITKSPNMLSKDLKASLKSVVGTCVSLGILVENKHASEIEKEIDQGNYDKEIKEKRTTTPPEKKKKLDEYFEKIKAEQDKILKQEAAAKEAEAAAKEAEAPATTAVAATATTVTAATPAAKTAAKPSAKPPKK